MVRYRNKPSLDELVGEVLTHIDVADDEILLTTASGRQFRLYHIEDCCEHVCIEDTEGNWHDLIGKKLVAVDEDVQPEGDPPPEFSDSWTRTVFTFRVTDATVICRWIGESNGCYSENVNIQEIVNPKTTPGRCGRPKRLR